MTIHPHRSLSWTPGPRLSNAFHHLSTSTSTSTLTATHERGTKRGGDPAGPNNTLNTALNMVNREAGEASTRPALDWAALPPPALDVVARRAIADEALAKWSEVKDPSGDRAVDYY